MKVIIVLLSIITIWMIGGIRLDELKVIGREKAIEICGSEDIIYNGYERSIFFGFGGRVWYQCKQDNIWYRFYISRRINSSEPQVYNFKQMTTFPSKFNINN